MEIKIITSAMRWTGMRSLPKEELERIAPNLKPGATLIARGVVGDSNVPLYMYSKYMVSDGVVEAESPRAWLSALLDDIIVACMEKFPEVRTIVISQSMIPNVSMRINLPGYQDHVAAPNYSI